MYKVFNGGGHGAVHHFESGGDDAGGNHRRHRVAGFAQLVKAGHDAARQLRLGYQLDGDFGGHGQHAFAADNNAEQVVARRVQRVAAELDFIALDGEAAHLEHVMNCQPVFEAVHAARVFSHVAAYGAGDLARRVWRVVQAQRRGRFRNSQVAHAALHHGCAAGGIHFQNLVELGQRERHAQLVRHGAARQAGARAARHHRHAQRVAGFEHALHLRIGLWQHHHQRPLAVSRQAVAFVGCGVFRRPQQGVLRHHLLQSGHHLGLPSGAFHRCLVFWGNSCIHIAHFKPCRPSAA